MRRSSLFAGSPLCGLCFNLDLLCLCLREKERERENPRLSGERACCIEAMLQSGSTLDLLCLCVSAQVVVNPAGAGNKACNLLARFTFGDNQEQLRLKMTAPEFSDTAGAREHEAKGRRRKAESHTRLSHTGNAGMKNCPC
jgi:hypothetical protein